jgi:hypothetical protein
VIGQICQNRRPAVTGISFARSQGVSPEDCGKFIGKRFMAFRNPEDGFVMLVNRMMYILAGLHPDNEMAVVRQDPKSVAVKLKNVDLSFKNGPMFVVSCKDFLEWSYGIISMIADHMGSIFSYNNDEEGWYEAIFTEK